MDRAIAISDIHMEWGNVVSVPKIEGVKYLILAGDIGSGMSYLPFIKACAEVYTVIHILGNHEFYGHSLAEVRNFWKSVKLDNYHFLDNSSVVIDGIEFIGSTLWINFNNENFHCMYNAQKEIKDFSKIINSAGDDYITPEEILAEYNLAYSFLEKAIYDDNGLKKVLVTHYGISHQSVHPSYLVNQHTIPLNHYFTNNLDYFIGYSKLSVAIHGHMHTSSDYMIGDCRVICNPLGYPDGLNELFDISKVIDL